MAASLGDEAALVIYKTLLDITRKLALNLQGVKRLLFYSDQIVAQDLWPNDQFQKYLQSNSDLGDRMEQAFDFALAHSKKVLIIGSDCPYLNVDIINDAYAQLDHHDVVLGPTLDGGYYLLGMKQLHSTLFEKIPWSTEKVFPLTITRLKNAGLSYWVAPKLSDIDYAEDWHAYLQSLQK